MVITDPILFLGCPPNPPHFMGVHQTLGICWVMHTGPPPGGGHISWVLTRPSWSAHLWMPTRMLTFVSRSHSPSWEDGSGCTPGRHPLRLHLAHLVITAATFCIISRSPGHYCPTLRSGSPLPGCSGAGPDWPPVTPQHSLATRQPHSDHLSQQTHSHNTFQTLIMSFCYSSHRFPVLPGPR